MGHRPIPECSDLAVHLDLTASESLHFFARLFTSGRRRGSWSVCT